jgi:predicted house-cleaning noncanonical NTP pyrophosphatase (MazG superfamily)
VAVVEIVRSDLNEILTDEAWEHIAATISVELNLAVTGEFCKGRFEAMADEKLARQG